MKALLFFLQMLSNQSLIATLRTSGGNDESRDATLWTFVITSIALFMVVLDNLVVSTALPVIRVDLGATIEELEWTVNAYTLTFAVFVLTGAALGDRFGRRRMFMIGVGIFTAASAAAALAPSAEWLIAARAVQGFGGAIVTPLTLTILSAAVAREKRGLALGAWSGIAGLAVAMGPLVGGAVVDGISWQWIFWLNVPVGIVLLPLASLLRESTGPDKALDIPGLALASGGLLGIVWGLIHGQGDGWTSPSIVGALALGAALLVGIRRLGTPDAAADAPDAVLPQPGIRGCERRIAAHVLRDVRLDLPAEPVLPDRAGLLAARRRPTHPPVDAHADVRRSDRRSALRPHRRQAAHGDGLALQAVGLGWIAAVSSATTGYASFVGPFIVSGIGMALFFAPVANVVLSAVRPQEEGKASGANNSIREVGGVLGVAVMASIFVRYGGYESPETFSDGIVPALWVGAAVLAAGSLVSLLIPGRAVRAGLGARARARPATRGSLSPSEEEGGDVVKLSTQIISTASAQHPWRTIGAWVVAFTLAIAAVGILLGDSLTTDGGPTNNPESVRARTCSPAPSRRIRSGSSPTSWSSARSSHGRRAGFRLRRGARRRQRRGGAEPARRTYRRSRATGWSRPIGTRRSCPLAILDDEDEPRRDRRRRAGGRGAAFEVSIAGDRTLDHDFNLSRRRTSRRVSSSSACRRR